MEILLIDIDMLAEEIKNKLSDLANRGMNDWESHRTKPRLLRPEMPSGLKRNPSRGRTIQLKLFEI